MKHDWWHVINGEKADQMKERESCNFIHSII